MNKFTRPTDWQSAVKAKTIPSKGT